MSSIVSGKRPDGKVVAIALIAWLVVAFTVGAAGCFRAATAPMVAATVWMLTAIALVACWKIGPIRNWMMQAEPRWLVLVHLSRFVGVYFLVLCRRGELPEAFAVPAGIGDIFVAATALVILLLGPERISRPLLLAWNIVGGIDIVFVVFTALRMGLSDWQSMAALRHLPLSLLPTFLVPLIITSHVLIFVRLAGSKASAPI